MKFCPERYFFPEPFCRFLSGMRRSLPLFALSFFHLRSPPPLSSVFFCLRRYPPCPYVSFFQIGDMESSEGRFSEFSSIASCLMRALCRARLSFFLSSFCCGIVGLFSKGFLCFFVMRLSYGVFMSLRRHRPRLLDMLLCFLAGLRLAL